MLYLLWRHIQFYLEHCKPVGGAKDLGVGGVTFARPAMRRIVGKHIQYTTQFLCITSNYMYMIKLRDNKQAFNLSEEVFFPEKISCLSGGSPGFKPTTLLSRPSALPLSYMYVYVFWFQNQLKLPPWRQPPTCHL